MKNISRRWFSRTAVRGWKSPIGKELPQGKTGKEDEAQIMMKEQNSLRPIKPEELKASVGMLLNQKEVQHLLADSLSPYDQLDPVLISALLRDDLNNFLEKCGTTREQFIADYDDVRGPETTRAKRQAFMKKYKFNPFTVVYREEQFTLTDAELAAFKVQPAEIRVGKTNVEAEYTWWESHLDEMFSIGYTYSDYEEMRRWIASPKNFNAVVLHQFNVLALIYKVCAYTRRIDALAAEKMLSPRYLPTWQEVVDAFRLDIPEPQNWRPMHPITAIELARRIDDYNRNFNGIYNNISYPTFAPHFFDTHVSCHPLKYHCKATATIIVPTQEYINSLAEYLVSRALTYKAQSVPILEVGSGTGRLSWLLNQTDAFKEAGIKAVATDLSPVMNPFLLHFNRSERAKFQAFDNEAISEQEAVEKYCPAIIVCQMMPNGVDWPKNWRKNNCVLEYVLVGPPDSIACGQPWATWGVSWGTNIRQFTPPFFAEGFKKLYLDNISRYLIGQDEHAQCPGLNRVVSFRRMTPFERFIRTTLHRSKAIAFVSFFVGLAYLTLPEE
eukprot:TRINITY_DN14848_c0_g1_i1.p1 TRINITY_DN14848_c0_g1~~TRINITY_DN14848_c0_g1_i1.p1  ORF type:complete len:572 (+),score=167.69 TRINITY_DN14848_c0_g1_i1:52-1716(+)